MTRADTPAARRARRARQAREDAVRAAWDRIPDPGCTGRCHEACGPIAMTDTERAMIERRYRVRIEDMDVKPGTLSCPALGAGQRCGVYDLRPTICRLYGAADGLRCPYGCEPVGGVLSRADAAGILREVAARE